MIKKLSGGEIYYRFTTTFAAQVSEIADSSTAFAIIYGYDTSYLYEGKALYPLGSVSISVDERRVLESVKWIENHNILLRNIEKSYDLQYSNTELNSRLPVYFSCNMVRVSQKPYNNLCWAASVACTVNYIKKTNHTVDSVVKDLRGSIIDEGLYPAEEIEVLKNTVLYIHTNIWIRLLMLC